ncbi:MAG: VOC family protein [Ktedonobacterales bacterium]
MSMVTIDPETRVGLLALTISDLDRSISFYTNEFGFAQLQRGDDQATLGAGGVPLLLLKEQPGARPFPHDRYGYTGLYHFAILVPTRADLGRWLAHWLETGHPLPGQGDHLVSEALYLTDPDGNGIEIYRDRPRDTWTWVNGQVEMATDPVDIRAMLAEAQKEGKSWSGLPAGTRLGHMHLQVGDIKQAVHFYHDTLGFDITAQMPTALFLSAGGYHHHLGMNTWHSKGAGPAPADVAGLRFFTIDFGGEPARAATVSRLAAAGVPHSEVAGDVVLEDPWHNTLVLQVGTAADVESAALLESHSATA